MTIRSGVSSYAYASTWWFLVSAVGELSADRSSPTTDGMAAVELGADHRPLLQDRVDAGGLAAERRADAGRRVAAERLEVEVAERDPEPVERLDLAAHEGVEAGRPVGGRRRVGGRGTFASNRSRAVSAMPPHSPAAASPNPRIRVSNGPKRTVGPGGNELGKRSP